MSAFTDRLEASFSALEPREQLFLKIGAVVVAVLLVVVLPWRLHSAAHKAALRVAGKQSDLAYVNSVLPLLASAPAVQDGVPLVTVVDSTSHDAGISDALRGTEPTGGDSLRVRFEGVSFAQLANWFVQLGSLYGVSVQQATMERTDAPGRVNASVVLVRH